MDGDPLCPGNRTMRRHLREASVKLWSGMLGVRWLFITVVNTTIAKSSLGREGFIRVNTSQSQWGKPRWEFKARIRRQKMKQSHGGKMLTGFSPWFNQFAFLYHLPRRGMPIVDWALPH